MGCQLVEGPPSDQEGAPRMGRGERAECARRRERRSVLLLSRQQRERANLLGCVGSVKAGGENESVALLDSESAVL